MGRSVAFDVSEYRLAFRRAAAAEAAGDDTHDRWLPLRPVLKGAARRTRLPAGGPAEGEVAQVFIVPLCSTLALDDRSYERFLLQSGVLDEALDLLTAASLAEPGAVETVRKEIQSLVMQAEVQHIVDGMSA